MNLNLSQNISSPFVINTSANFLETIFSFMLDIISYLMCIDPFSPILMSQFIMLLTV